MDGKAWHLSHYSQDHFKTLTTFGEDKYHYDYKPYLIEVKAEDFVRFEGEQFEFVALIPKSATRPQESPS